MQPQTVVVTGASAGVGRAVAIAHARRGAKVALLARGEAGLDAAAADVRRAGGTPLRVCCDVSDPAHVDAAAERVEQELGPIDVWINNAMVTVMAPTWEVPADEFRRVTEVNYLGAVHGTASALKRMRPRDAGTILQVGSALAFRGIPAQGPYCASQHALQGFTESLRAELQWEGSAIHVGLVHLPALNTPQFTWSRNRLPKAPQPVPPIYQPEVAARAIVSAGDRRRRQTWVGASTLLTVWADRFVPGLVDRHLARNGVEGQQTDLPAAAHPDDNLDAPLDATVDAGTRGPFDDRARDREFTSTVTGPLGLTSGFVTLAVVGAVAATRSARRRRRRLEGASSSRTRGGAHGT